MEKRGWIAWFTWKASKILRQEVCTTYVGHRRPSILPKERRHWGLPGRILEAQAKLVSLAGSALQVETQPEFERENDMGRPVFRGTDPIFKIFPESVFIHWDVIQKSCGSAVLTFINVRCFIQMYTEVLGVLHHLLARGLADNLWPSPCDSGQSTRTLISPGVIIFKTDATFQRYQIKLHFYRVRV